MGEFLVVSKLNTIEQHLALVKEYGVAFEINDFFEPNLLDSGEELEYAIETYERLGVPLGSTMHGVFYDIVPFSNDPEIQKVARVRMEQSVEIARRLGIKGVVFHTNVNPLLTSDGYERRVVSGCVEVLSQLLEAYPGMEIYLENMFEDTPAILEEISKELSCYDNYGVCLDYAHIHVYGKAVSREEWIRRLGPFIRHVHINDNDLVRDLHQVVGDGNIDWNEFKDFYLSHFKDCTVLIETTDPEDQRHSLNYLRDTLHLL